MIKLYQVQRNLNTWEFDNKFSDLQPIIKSSNWESHLTSQRRYKEDTKNGSLSLRVTITWCWGVIFPGAWTFSLWLETKTTRKFTCHRFASLYSVQVQEVVRGAWSGKLAKMNIITRKRAYHLLRQDSFVL